VERLIVLYLRNFSLLKGHEHFSRRNKLDPDSKLSKCATIEPSKMSAIIERNDVRHFSAMKFCLNKKPPVNGSAPIFSYEWSGTQILLDTGLTDFSVYDPTIEDPPEALYWCLRSFNAKSLLVDLVNVSLCVKDRFDGWNNETDPLDKCIEVPSKELRSNLVIASFPAALNPVNDSFVRSVEVFFDAFFTPIVTGILGTKQAVELICGPIN